MKQKVINNKKALIWCLSLVVFMGLWTSCSSDDSPAEVAIIPPSVVSVSPGSGSEGTTVTISGVNLVGSASDFQVSFNGTAATVTAATSTTITTSVPAGATAGNVTVMVGGTSISGSPRFDVLQAQATNTPTITSFVPESAIRGTEVIISGTNFSATPADNIVSFDGVMATVTAATTTEIKVTIPSLAVSGSNNVTVTTNNVAGTGPSFTVLFSQIVTIPLEDSDTVEESLGDGTTSGEPTPAGTMLFNLDLEFGEADSSRNGHLAIGLRFQNLDIPQGTKIESANIQFTTSEDVNVPSPVIMYMYGEAVDNSATFTEDLFNLTTRPKTTTRVDWGDIPEWQVRFVSGPDQKTADIAAIIEEIVSRPNWVAGNSITIIIENSPDTLLNGPEAGRVAYGKDDDERTVGREPVLTVIY